ncbi:MAG: ATP-binding protein [Longimicrobiales bacterium]
MDRAAPPLETPARLSVLVLADRADQGEKLASMLAAAEAPSFTVSRAGDIREALEILAGRPIDVVILDSDEAPGSALARLGAIGERRDIAIVVIGAMTEAADGAAIGALRRGAQDWLRREALNSDALVRAVRYAYERQRLAAALNREHQTVQESEARFRNIIQHTADGIVILDRDGVVRFANPAAEALFNRSRDELVGEDFGFPLLAGRTAEIDILRLGPDERAAVVELHVVETRWQGEPALLASLRDITDRKRAEERQQKLLLEQAAREQAEWREKRSSFLSEASGALDASLDYETTLSSLAGLIVPRMADWCVIDVFENGTLRHVAAAHRERRSDRLLATLRQAFPPSLLSSHPAAQVLRTRKPLLLVGLDRAAVQDFTTDERHADVVWRLGIRSLISVPLESRGDVLGAMTLVCHERDYDDEDVELAIEIAQRASQAIDNARLYHEALAANQAKSDFLAVVSHELRTPLNSIMGYTEILLAGLSGELPDRADEQLRRINASARHLLQIIEEILTFARMEAGREELRPEETTVGELIEEVIAVAEPLARERGLDFERIIDNATERLVLDARKVRQILLNLLSNAVKFTEYGSVSLHASVTDGMLVASVADSGIGIPEEHRETVFESFWQAEQASTRRSGGTGLGLSVSRRLAEMLGGTIELESEVGVGSTFTLRIPTRMLTEAASVSG